MRALILAATAAMAIGQASFAAEPAKLAPALAGLSFLLGTWANGQGRAADEQAAITGHSAFTAEAGGTVILRRDHTDVLDGAGHKVTGFDQIMTIYSENGAIHADYFDPGHVLHYVSAKIEPGKSVVFTTGATPGVPVFSLRYSLSPSHGLVVVFGMTPPGGSAFKVIATGTASKAP